LGFEYRFFWLARGLFGRGFRSGSLRVIRAFRFIGVVRVIRVIRVVIRVI
jgi:hypothetical protein